MEEVQSPRDEPRKSVKKEVPKKIVFLKKIDSETAKILGQIKDKANKKAFGRKVTDVEVIAQAFRGFNMDSIQELQEATYSEKDRLAMAHEEYQKAHGKISLDQFIGKLLKGEISNRTR